MGRRRSPEICKQITGRASMSFSDEIAKINAIFIDTAALLKN